MADVENRECDGGSGTGKTTLLEAMAAVRPADTGEVRFDCVDVYANLDAFRTVLGYLPQDDIIHADLPLERTLRYAARLRLPMSSSAEIDAAVRNVMETLDLSARADVRVGALSGGRGSGRASRSSCSPARTCSSSTNRRPASTPRPTPN